LTASAPMSSVEDKTAVKLVIHSHVYVFIYGIYLVRYIFISKCLRCNRVELRAGHVHDRQP